jgi:hypothetical protein
MKATEIRIGNYHFYHIIDPMDERKEWDEVCQIDAEDIAYLDKNPDDPDMSNHFNKERSNNEWK